MARFITLITAAGTLLTFSPPSTSGQVFPGPAFNVYGMQEGLSQGSVEALLQDETGFLWVGTHDGLNRFDGASFRVYKHARDDSTSLSDDYVRAIAEAGDGRLWVGTERGGLNRFDPLTGTAERFELHELGRWMLDARVDMNREGAGRTVREIARLGSDDLLLLSDAGLVRFNEADEVGSLVPPPGSSVASAICSLGREVLVGFEDGSVEAYAADGSWRPLPSVASSIRAMRCDGGRIRAIAAGGSIHQLDAPAERWSLLVDVANVAGPQMEVEDVVTASNGTTWIATIRGAFVMPPGAPDARPATNPGADRGPPDPWITRLLIDRGNVLWLGTWNGLASLSPAATAMNRIPTRRSGVAGLEGSGTVAIEKHPAGGLWVGTIGGGVQRVILTEPGGAAHITRPPALEPWNDATIFDLSPGEGGELWIAAHVSGVLRMTAGGAGAARVPVMVAGAEVPATANGVHRDPTGRVWATTEEHGLLLYDEPRDAFVPLSGPQWDLGSLYAWPIISASNGELWVGAYNGGVSRVDPEEGVQVRFGVGPAGISDARVLTVLEDSRGLVWVGTEGGGLNRIDPSTNEVRVLTTADGLPHDHVEGIIEDESGFLWVTTNDGLARFDPSVETFRVFGRPSGLVGARFLANAAFRDESGRLYFGGEDGLTIVDASRIGSAAALPRVALTRFRIQGREVPLARALAPAGLDLAPDERFFAFDFAALDFADPTQNRYRYRLDPLELDWIDAGAGTTANYTSVPPDDYVFRVAARSSGGIWTEDGLAIPVRVRAPFHMTWWFRLGMVVLALSLGSAAHQYRLGELRKRQKIRLDVAGKLHDSLSSDLSSIKMKAEDVASVLPPDSEAVKIVQAIAETARESLKNTSEKIWVYRPQHDTLPQLVSKMSDTADKMLIGQIPHTFSQEPAQMPALEVDWQLREDVFLLFKEALNNTLKHSGATRVETSVSFRAPFLEVRVSDNGVGFDPSTVREGYGQGQMRDRMARHRGELAVATAPEGGTSIFLRVRVV